MRIINPLLTSCAGLCMLVALGGQVIAQDGQSELPEVTDDVELITAEEALVIDGKAYAERYGVSLEEAMRRLTIMAGTAEEIDALEEEFGDQLAGIYFQNGQDFELVVRLTGAEARNARRLERRAERREARRDARREARRAERRAQRRAERRGISVSEAEAQLAAKVIEQDASTEVVFEPRARQSKRAVRKEMRQAYDAIKLAIPTLEAVLYDEVEGNVVIRAIGSAEVVPDSAIEPFASRFTVPVILERKAEPLSDVTLRGGAQLYYASANTNQCTTGFVGWAPPKSGQGHSTEFGIFTAGHCRSEGFGIGYKDASGKMHTLIEDSGLLLDNLGADIRFLKAPVGLGAASEFYADNNTSARKLTGRRTIASTTGTVVNQGKASTATRGTFVCFYGMRTGPANGQGCGEVTYNGISYGGGTGYFVEFKGTFACNQGDSGSPVFAYSTAFGVVSGCRILTNTPAINNELAYTSMDAAYDKGYRLSY